jgi:hypothetical protein
MKTMPVEPAYLKADIQGKAIGVDHENKVIRGFVLAQQGDFKTPGRGAFNEASLSKIVELAPDRGLKSRFTHPSMSDDGLGSFLGRVPRSTVRMDTANVLRDGAPTTVKAVRGDLHLADVAFTSPKGNLGQYVLDLAEKDPEALSSSLVLKAKREYRLNPDGTRQKNAKGEDLSPIWTPERLHSSDIVDTGDAVDGLLSAGIELEALPDELQRRGWEMLDQVFAGQPRDAVRARLLGYVERYLLATFGEDELEERRAELLAKIAEIKKLSAV